MLPPVQAKTTQPVVRRYTAEPKPDTFQPSEPAPLIYKPILNQLDLRPTQQAVDFVARYTAELKVSPEGQQERDENMRKSPATCFRMFPSLFHADMRGAYAEQSRLLDRPSPQIVINGDCHLGNYGTMRDGDEGVKWALNDYDQTGRGPAERDLERLATSIVLLGQEGGLSAKESLKLVKRCAESYLHELAHPTKSAGLGQADAHGPVKDLIEKASGKTHAQMVEKFAEPGPDGSWQLRRNEDLADVPAELNTAIQQGVRDLEQGLAPTPGIGRPLEILDVCRKLGSGGSSKGLDRYYVLLGGVPADPLPAILELKQILPCPIDSPSGDLSLADPGQIVANQAALGGPENPLNGATVIAGDKILAREREGEKLDLKLEKLTKSGWESVVDQAGTVLAQAHCHQNREALQAWVGEDGDELVHNLTTFARHYSAQAIADFNALKSAG